MSRIYTMFAVFLALASASAASAQSVSKDIARAPNGAYQLDSTHSQIVFSILHMGITNYYGRFNHVSGMLNLDANQPERSAVAITIDTASVDTPSNRLTEDLRSSSTFDSTQFPTASFRSTSIVRTGPSTGRIMGNLTIRNVTRPVTLDCVFSGGADNPLNDTFAVGFHATTTIRRSDFGLTEMSWSSLVGDDVQLSIEVMFQHAKD